MNDINRSSIRKYRRCDYLGCTGEAPFHCSVCTKYYCQVHPYHHDCNENEKYFPYNSDRVVPNNNKNVRNISKCDYLGCTGNAPFYCSACVKHYCQEHPFNHECRQGIQFTSTKNSKSSATKKIQKNKFKKCDYPGCTGEAPFFCSVCKKYYCARHPFSHECHK